MIGGDIGDVHAGDGVAIGIGGIGDGPEGPQRVTVAQIVAGSGAVRFVGLIDDDHVADIFLGIVHAVILGEVGDPAVSLGASGAHIVPAHIHGADTLHRLDDRPLHLSGTFRTGVIADSIGALVAPLGESVLRGEGGVAVKFIVAIDGGIVVDDVVVAPDRGHGLPATVSTAGSFRDRRIVSGGILEEHTVVQIVIDLDGPSDGLGGIEGIISDIRFTRLSLILLARLGCDRREIPQHHDQHQQHRQ